MAILGDLPNLESHLLNQNAYDTLFHGYCVAGDRAAEVVALGKHEFTSLRGGEGQEPQMSDFGLIYQADLATIGVKLNVNNLQVAVWNDMVLHRKYVGVYAPTGTYSQMDRSHNSRTAERLIPTRITKVLRVTMRVDKRWVD